MVHVGTIVTGLVILAVCGAIVVWRGGRLERTVALIGFVCWSGGAAGQLLTGSNLGPGGIGDLALAAALLVLILRHHRLWLYALFAVEAARLILHAVDFHSPQAPSDFYRLTNTILRYS